MTLQMTCSFPEPSKRNGLTSMSYKDDSATLRNSKRKSIKFIIAFIHTWFIDSVAHFLWSNENPTHLGGTSGLRSIQKTKCWPGPVLTSIYFSLPNSPGWIIARFFNESSSVGHLVALKVYKLIILDPYSNKFDILLTIDILINDYHSCLSL